MVDRDEDPSEIEQGNDFYGIGKPDIRFRCDFSSTQAKAMRARGWTKVTPGDPSWRIWWCETSDARQALDAKLEPQQKIPHFRNHYELTRKDHLCRNLKRYKKLLLKLGKIGEAALCDSMPITFELPNDYGMLAEQCQRQQGSTWIVKPAAGSQGRGIFLFRKLKDLSEFRAKQHFPQTSSARESFLVQKYVEKPYLLAGRKFDLRIYVLVASFQPLKVWLAREGFARLSSRKFDLRNIEDSRVHLTNVSIQSSSAKPDTDGVPPPYAGEEAQRGCKWALAKVRQYLTARHGVLPIDRLFQTIAGVIMASLLAVQPVMMQARNSFELYGYDVLLDDSLKPWLLEVNASPALSATDADDFRLKFDLVEDSLNVLDFEARFSGRETRIGGWDLLWNDGPVWTSRPRATVCDEGAGSVVATSRKLNIFLAASNDDRQKQLRSLRSLRSHRSNGLANGRRSRNSEKKRRAAAKSFHRG